MDSTTKLGISDHVSAPLLNAGWHYSNENILTHTDVLQYQELANSPDGGQNAHTRNVYRNENGKYALESFVDYQEWAHEVYEFDTPDECLRAVMQHRAPAPATHTHNTPFPFSSHTAPAA
tara:strand:+ start:393 stop:752 length:360 start_codon:yes stop_codon:yes gene_type:complete